MQKETGTRVRRGFDSPEQEAYLNLWRAYDRLRQVEDELFQQHEITAQQYNALRLLQAADGRLPTLAIAAGLISRAPDITRLLDRLEERGLIDRERPAGDRRSVTVGLTPAGRTLLAGLAEPVRRCHAAQLGHLEPEELRELTRLLRKARRPHEVGKQWASPDEPVSPNGEERP
jgi:MarR family 2-MHQ and catechol resistance regulon transcriptional repressor